MLSLLTYCFIASYSEVAIRVFQYTGIRKLAADVQIVYIWATLVVLHLSAAVVT